MRGGGGRVAVGEDCTNGRFWRGKRDCRLAGGGVTTRFTQDVWVAL